MSEAGDNDLNDSLCSSTDGSSHSGGPRSISSSDSDVDNRLVIDFEPGPSTRADTPLSMSDDSDDEVNDSLCSSTDGSSHSGGLRSISPSDSDVDTQLSMSDDSDDEVNDSLCSSTDGSSHSGGPRSISPSDSDVDTQLSMSDDSDDEVNDSLCSSTDGSSHSGGPRLISSSDSDNDTPPLFLSVDSDGELIVVDNTLSPADDSDDDSSGSEYMPRPSGYSNDEFVTRKMKDRPPRYEDIENDRIVSPVGYVEAPIVHSYDQAPNADSSDEPPPVYDASHYVRPGLQSTLTTFMSNRNRVVQPNYSTVTEVTTMTTSEVGIRRDNLQNTLQYQMIYTNCRSHSTSTTVYKGPRMTTALNGIVPNHEEIAKRDWPSLLSTVRTPIRPRPPEIVSYYFNSRLHTRTHYEFVLQRNQHRPPR